MTTKKYYWLKLKKDFFVSRAMKKLRKIAGGDTYTIIYLKLQLLSIENDGRLFYEGIEPTFAEEMALALDEDVENVEATLIFLEKAGLLNQETETDYLLCEVPYLIGSECDSAERVRRLRSKKALQCNDDVTNCNDGVTKCNTEKEKEREKERELDIETDKIKIDYQLIADMYNDTCVSFPKVKSLSEARKKAIKARLKVYTIDDFKQLFQLAEESSFLKGGNSRNWSANFDWLIKDANFAKVLDGNYANKAANGMPINEKAAELNNFYEMTSNWASKGGEE